MLAWVSDGVAGVKPSSDTGSFDELDFEKEGSRKGAGNISASLSSSAPLFCKNVHNTPAWWTPEN